MIQVIDNLEDILSANKSIRRLSLGYDCQISDYALDGTARHRCDIVTAVVRVLTVGRQTGLEYLDLREIRSVFREPGASAYLADALRSALDPTVQQIWLPPTLRQDTLEARLLLDRRLRANRDIRSYTQQAALKLICILRTITLSRSRGRWGRMEKTVSSLPLELVWEVVAYLDFPPLSSAQVRNAVRFASDRCNLSGDPLGRDETLMAVDCLRAVGGLWTLAESGSTRPIWLRSEVVGFLGSIQSWVCV